MARLMTPARLFLTLLMLGTLAATSAYAQSVTSSGLDKLGQTLQPLAAQADCQARVIIRATDPSSVDSLSSSVKNVGGLPGRTLRIINSLAATIPCVALTGLANNPHVESISENRRISGSMERTGATIGATAVRQQLGYDGSGVGVAIIDSGVTSFHDDLTYAVGGGQRIDRFVDFVGTRSTSYDDYGHGTHVAGIIAGNGFDSSGARSGIAPGAHLIALKALDSHGNGVIGDVIAAMDYAVAHKAELNIRVMNLSVATGVYESYYTDPLTVAARAAVKAGIVVVAAAGNNGVGPTGHMQYGGTTAPGNAPWVLTVGASSHQGTIDRADDIIAKFSSRGPTAIDLSAKPDVVAPGVGIESLSDPNSTMYTSKAAYLLHGTVPTSYLPYLSLSGTSMATPVVTGSVALMLQANPSLTPNAVKAILQYTAEARPGWDPLTEGSGFLNTKGAVRLARFLANPSGAYPTSADWSGNVIWGNYVFHGGRLDADATAWSADVTWGAAHTASGQNVDWGSICTTGTCYSGSGTWTQWDVTAHARNVVWGNVCGGTNCSGPWSIAAANNGDTVVWGTSGGDTVVWGTSDGDTVVWGTSDGDTVVWGTSCADSSCEPVIWNR